MTAGGGQGLASWGECLAHLRSCLAAGMMEVTSSSSQGSSTDMNVARVREREHMEREVERKKGR